MALPAAVQRQIDEADALAQALYGPEAVAAARAAEAGTGDAPAEQSPTPAPPPPQDAPASGAEDWRHKYQVLQGKYNAEVPRLTATLREQTGTITRLNEEMASLRAQVERLQKPASVVITPQEVEDYSAEMLDVVGRRARAEISPELDDVRAQVNEMRSRLASVSKEVVETKQERVLRTLDQQVENWREQNDDAGFGEWLDALDPLSRQIRRDMLGRAFSLGDGAAVVAFFNAYRNEHAAMQAPTQGSYQGPPTVDLREFTAPGRAAATSQGGAQAEKRIWSAADITRFYADVRRGVFRGREAEQRALEQDIVRADAEGRIR